MESDKLGTVLITDDVHEVLIKGLEELSYDIDFQPNIQYDDIFDIIHNYSGIIINSKVKMNKKMMSLSPKLQNGDAKLRFIGRLGSGLEIIDQPVAREMGIAVFSAPQGNRNAVAEHAMGMLLSLANQLIWADQDVRNFAWDRESRRGFEIEGKTIGIIGFGNNGSCFAEKLAGFGVKVLAFDKFKKGYSSNLDFVKECESMDEVISNSDVISLHVPLDTNTHFLIDDDFILKCKKEVIIINSARGKCVDTKALIKGLKSGQIQGACLDVFENEKTATYSEDERVMYNELYKMKQVILSPHVAGWTHESKYKIADFLLCQIRELTDKL